jgi:hypothetical protein
MPSPASYQSSIRGNRFGLDLVGGPVFPFQTRPPIWGGGAFTSDATAGARTYTSAEILGGVIVRDPNGASRTDTLPTAALLVAAIIGAQVGDVVRCYIVNGADAAETITVNAGTGGTYDTNETAVSRLIGQNASKWVHIRLTNVTTGAEAYAVCM